MRRLLSSSFSAISRYSAVEVASALARRAREGTMSEAECDEALAALNEDLPAFVIVELTHDIVREAHGLLRRHALRAGDAIQLASCLQLREQQADEVALIAFDDRLRRAALKEQLRLE